MRVLLTGATGFVGGAICSELLRAGHEVRAVARRAPPGPDRPGLEWIEGDFAQDHTAQVWLPRLEGVDAVVNAVGIIREAKGSTFEAVHQRAPIALFEACRSRAISQVVQISAMGVADPGSTMPYQTTKLAADNWLQGSGLSSVILRPSLIQGVEGESAQLFRELAALPIVPIVGSGQYPLRPLQVDDLSRAVRLALELQPRVTGCFDIGGAQVVTLEEMLLCIRSWLGERPSGPTLKLPSALVGFAARIGDLTGVGMIDSATWKMLQAGSAAPIDEFTEAFGFTPRGLAESLALAPAGPALRWHARLRPLKVPIRLLVASIWLITPAVSLWRWELSLSLLHKSGFHAEVSPILLVSSCAFEVLLAISLLTGRLVRWTGAVQIALMVFYTGVLSITQPELWLDPLGSLSKNLPLIAATLAMIALEDPR